MKSFLLAIKLLPLAFLFFLLTASNQVIGQKIAPKSGITKAASNEKYSFTFPFSQYVIRSDWAMPITWKYRPFQNIRENENVIAPPAFGENWDAWYSKMKSYQSFLRGHLRDTNALYLEMKIPKSNSIRLFYKRVFNPLRLQPNDEISFNGVAKNNKGNSNFSIQLIYIKIGQELSHAIVKTDKIDNVIITESATNLHKSFKIPDYDTKNLMVQPVVFFSSQNNDTTVVEISNLTVSVTSNAFNQQKFNEIKSSFYPTNTSVDRQLYDRKEMQWVKSNFISGLAYIWDTDFWDSEKKRFTVQKYCDKMKAAFNGFQSVLFWYSYPNIGIDNRNTWEILNAVPGGMDSLKAMVKTFHKNGVKVYFPYTPWEVDTRKTDTYSDAEHWGKILKQIDGDGLFFDTFYDGGDFQAALDKYKKGISIGTEHHPSLQNIQGYNAVTTSWGQTIEPYKNNGISRLKWIIPEHIQWKINRNEKNRQNSMAYSWINGQGILVWENIFGYMNKWNGKDRQTLRKINTIYQTFCNLYTSDSWKPYLPTARLDIHLSSWENVSAKIWNIVADSANVVASFELPADKNFNYYYDAWTGEKLSVNNHKIIVPLQRFSCVIGLKNLPTPFILSMLKKQSAETLKPLPVKDDYVTALSAKLPKLPLIVSEQNTSSIITNLLPIKAGVYKISAEHFRREGNCYPDENAKNNDDYKVVKNSFNNYLIVHKTEQKLPDLQIMQSVVSNVQFAAFLAATNYKPEDTTNFLQHWHSKKCPDSLLEKPVVYVSLQDARAFAKWAGLRLPTEWEWQTAGETNGDKFKFNDVWEWNESERFDGNNYFVTLRGGCSNWQLQTSNWYFPGTPNNQKPGGAQPLNSHCKYYILHTGYDRAGTLGFRCIK